MDRVVGPSGDMSSPLKHFTNAKKKINVIFNEISGYVKEFNEFIVTIENQEDDLTVEQELKDEVLASLGTINGIKDMVNRNHMKVVFFGRTSNGKSTVINAMLWDKILPSGIGHTTNCFLSIAGCNDEQHADKDVGYLLCSDSDEHLSIKSVTQLSHALSQESMSCDSLIQVFWPKKKCALLKDDVVLLDSPGIDVSSDLDNWIDNYCQDADVFILVANAESTLMQAEKKFFHRVNEKLSKPNVFILNNRWDASANEPELMEQVRQQHLERGISFLADELKVVSKEQAKDRVFFVSAKEVLYSRLKKLQGTEPSTPSFTMADGYQARLLEFAQFEREFEECISQSATRTKFHYHAQRASKIVDNLYTHAQWLHKSATEMIKKDEERRDLLRRRLANIDQQLRTISEQTRQGIAFVSAEAEKQVRSAMSDEIQHLPLLVDEFQRPFHPNPMVLRVYKSELYRHVQEGLGRNLNARCSATLQKQIDRHRRDMIEGIRPLLLPPSACTDDIIERSDDSSLVVVDDDAVSPRYRQLTRVASTHPSFDISYDIECASLCADFEEDIEFKFSLGLMQLLERFSGPSRKLRTGGIPNNTNAAQNTGGGGHDHEVVHPPARPMIPEDVLWSLASSYFKFTETNSAVLVVGCGMFPYLFWKSVGWRAVAFTAAAYGALYMYERLTWTSRAKERALKRQFVEHATDKLNLIISFTSSNCSHQVQQELSGTFTQLCCDVDEVRNEISREADDLSARTTHLLQAQTRVKTLRNKAGWLASELANFTKLYLTPLPLYNGAGSVTSSARMTSPHRR